MVLARVTGARSEETWGKRGNRLGDTRAVREMRAHSCSSLRKVIRLSFSLRFGSSDNSSFPPSFLISRLLMVFRIDSSVPLRECAICSVFSFLFRSVCTKSYRIGGSAQDLHLFSNQKISSRKRQESRLCSIITQSERVRTRWGMLGGDRRHSPPASKGATHAQGKNSDGGRPSEASCLPPPPSAPFPLEEEEEEDERALLTMKGSNPQKIPVSFVSVS
mmetsp:Transcript_8477/g.16518  ORF Transcript_8477/g.16518 Transcript_8477/m.16518 type:complete len:219 (+) Transcript_8477:529-1185(+)